jgi:small-conductance mechanosensitive channel
MDLQKSDSLDGGQAAMGRHDQKLDRVRVSHRTRQYMGARTASVCRLAGGMAAALVLATKELILCWSGTAVRVGGKVYTVGDRVQIAGHRGVVLDHDIFATKLLEIGPGQTAHLYTGRVTIFPNSLLFSHPLVKENPDQEYD